MKQETKELWRRLNLERKVGYIQIQRPICICESGEIIAPMVSPRGKFGSGFNHGTLPGIICDYLRIINIEKGNGTDPTWAYEKLTEYCELYFKGVLF